MYRLENSLQTDFARALLLEAGTDPNDSREGWGTVLQVATFKGDELIVKHLLKANANVNLHGKGTPAV